MTLSGFLALHAANDPNRNRCLVKLDDIMVVETDLGSPDERTSICLSNGKIVSVTETVEEIITLVSSMDRRSK